MAAYVTMIPKASGGSRPQDQRPITVLDVVYRLWAKGITQVWAPVLQGSYLGPTVMGFRAQASTLHLAQLLTDCIELQRRRGQALWLIKFDVAKCFPSLPWWALFGTMEETGISPVEIRCFRDLYARLRHRFRYGQVDGVSGTWLMALRKDVRPAQTSSTSCLSLSTAGLAPKESESRSWGTMSPPAALQMMSLCWPHPNLKLNFLYPVVKPWF